MSWPSAGTSTVLVALHLLHVSSTVPASMQVAVNVLSSGTHSCSVGSPISVSSSLVAPQVSQVYSTYCPSQLSWMTPLSHLWPSGSLPTTGVSSPSTAPQPVQTLPAIAGSVQVAGITVSSYLCSPVAAMGSVFVAWQTLQVNVLTPSAPQVGSCVTSPSPHLWLMAGITLVSVSLHTSQVYSISPSSVQVAAVFTSPSSHVWDGGMAS